MGGGGARLVFPFVIQAESDFKICMGKLRETAQLRLYIGVRKMKLRFEACV